MIRHALILFAGLLAALTFACVAVAPPPVQRVKAVPQVCLDKGISDGRTFISTQQVQYLFGNPDPSAMYPGYGSGPRGYGPVGPPYDDDLLKAFDSAPPFFQADLCRLTKIFINLNDCSDTSCLNISWGYREQPRQFAALYNGPFARYIAISKGLWFGGGLDAIVPSL